MQCNTTIHMYLNRGYELEDRVLYELQRLTGIVEIFTERELTRIHGWLAASVDFLVETSDQLIFIQVKYLSTRRKESVNINKFINSIEFIRSQLTEEQKQKKVRGLWVSKLHPFTDNESLLQTYNIRVVSCFESMDTLVSRTVECIA